MRHQSLPLSSCAHFDNGTAVAGYRLGQKRYDGFRLNVGGVNETCRLEITLLVNTLQKVSKRHCL